MYSLIRIYGIEFNWFSAECGASKLVRSYKGVRCQLYKPFAFLQTKTQEDARRTEKSLGEIQQNLVSGISCTNAGMYYTLHHIYYTLNTLNHSIAYITP